LRDLSGLPDEGPLLRTVRLCLQSAAGLWRPALVRARAFLRLGRLRLGARSQGMGPDSGALDPAGYGIRRRSRTLRRLARHTAARHLLRDDHAGHRADVLFLLRSGAV